MTPAPEQEARETIDKLLDSAGWVVQDTKDANIHAARGVAIREFPLSSGFGFADYLLYVDARAAGVIEAKKVGTTLSGVEVQSRKYTEGLPESLPAWIRPLPFHYQSTGVETRITNRLDPEPRARNVFAFHRPDTLAKILGHTEPVQANRVSEKIQPFGRPSTFLSRVRQMPPLIEDGLWTAQIKAIQKSGALPLR